MLFMVILMTERGELLRVEVPMLTNDPLIRQRGLNAARCGLKGHVTVL